LRGKQNTNELAQNREAQEKKRQLIRGECSFVICSREYKKGGTSMVEQFRIPKNPSTLTSQTGEDSVGTEAQTNWGKVRVSGRKKRTPSVETVQNRFLAWVPPPANEGKAKKSVVDDNRATR